MVGPGEVKRVVVSAVNLTEAGPLKVLRDFVDAACETLPAEWEIYVFVHDERLLRHPRARLIAIPHAKRRWLLRLRVEWFEFRKYARELRPDLWVSLHDITPWIGDVPQVVYCHNAIPLSPARWREFVFLPTQLFIRIAYALLYRIRLNRNRAIIVQQEWLRERFREWARESVQIIVAHPSHEVNGPAGRVVDRQAVAGPKKFLFPTLARPFKNIELIGAALERLEKKPDWTSQVVVTVDGTENRYASWLKRRFGSLRTLRLVGRQSHEQMQARYAEADCLLFPSRMESWGLPITEAKAHGLAIFAADLPYAHETVGNYDRAAFVNLDDADALARKMLDFQEGRLRFAPTIAALPAEPFANGWRELVEVLVRFAD
jgi:glycosyltransferase involved in cell wall biosynthesis